MRSGIERVLTHFTSRWSPSDQRCRSTAVLRQTINNQTRSQWSIRCCYGDASTYLSIPL